MCQGFGPRMEDTAEKLKMKEGDTIFVRMREGFLLKEEPPSSLQHEYLALLEDGSLADVRLLLGPGRTPLKIHRAIVCARSPHFRSLLQTFPGIESGKAEIEIPDCDPTLMKYLLQYIYAEKVTIPEGIDNALELLCLADRYLCGGLKERIEFHMMAKVSEDTIVPLLCAAYHQNTERLKRHCKQFLLKHWHSVPNLELLRANPELMYEIAEAAVDAYVEREQAAQPLPEGEPKDNTRKRRRESGEG
eukprot:EG_transcript_1844